MTLEGGFRALIGTYLVFVLVCVGATSAWHFYAPEEMRNVSLSIWEVFYGVFGIIYAIVVGFILAELLSRFNELKLLISKELNNLECIRDSLIYLDGNEEAKNNILDAIKEYIGAIIKFEWKQMEAIAKAGSAGWTRTEDGDTSEQLYELMRAIESIRCSDDSDRLVLGYLIQRVADITVFRTQRYEYSSSGLSPLLRRVVVFLSFILIVGIILIFDTSLTIHVFMVSSMTCAVLLLFAVIEDLNNPYEGVWRVSPGGFRGVASRLDQPQIRTRLMRCAP